MTASPDRSQTVVVDFLSRLGGAMIAANYPVNLVRRTLTRAADRYGLVAHHLVVLPSYIQLGGSDHTGGTLVRVVNLRNGLDVVVRINDRGPFTHGRVIDLSYAAAQRVNMIRAGVVPVRIQVQPGP